MAINHLLKKFKCLWSGHDFHKTLYISNLVGLSGDSIVILKFCKRCKAVYFDISPEMLKMGELDIIEYELNSINKNAQQKIMEMLINGQTYKS